MRFRTIAELVATERACVWTLGGLLDQDQFDLLLRESEEASQPFTDGDGFVSFDMTALILIARKESQEPVGSLPHLDNDLDL